MYVSCALVPRTATKQAYVHEPYY